METICMKCQVIVWMSGTETITDHSLPMTPKGTANKPRMTDNTQATDQRKAKQPGPEDIKLLFMLNSAEHEIFSANKYDIY